MFLISEAPRILSGEFRFKFDKGSFSETNVTPWQVIPVWLENPATSIPEGFRTCFEIPTKNEMVFAVLRKEATEQLNSRMLLFLSNLKNLTIEDRMSHTTRSIHKQEIAKSSNYEIHLIQESLNGGLSAKEEWLVFRDEVKVPDDVRLDQTTKDWERDTLTKSEVAVAFRLDSDRNLVIEEKGTAYIGVFSFLPLKEVPSGLNFLIQADFLTTPGRSELARDSAWNEWLAKVIFSCRLGSSPHCASRRRTTLSMSSEMPSTILFSM